PESRAQTRWNQSQTFGSGTEDRGVRPASMSSNKCLSGGFGSQPSVSLALPPVDVPLPLNLKLDLGGLQGSRIFSSGLPNVAGFTSSSATRAALKAACACQSISPGSGRDDGASGNSSTAGRVIAEAGRGTLAVSRTGSVAVGSPPASPIGSSSTGGGGDNGTSVIGMFTNSRVTTAGRVGGRPASNSKTTTACAAKVSNAAFGLAFQMDRRQLCMVQCRTPPTGRRRWGGLLFVKRVPCARRV